MLLKFYISETPLIEFDLDHKHEKPTSSTLLTQGL